MGSSCCTTQQQGKESQIENEVLLNHLNSAKSDHATVKYKEDPLMSEARSAQMQEPGSEIEIAQAKEAIQLQISKPIIKFEMYVTNKDPEEKKEEEASPQLSPKQPPAPEELKDSTPTPELTPQTRPLQTDSIYKEIQSPIPGDLGSRSVKSMKIGVDLFVNLKKGSITKYYALGQVLGQGAFGKVCKVTHKTTGIVRAMKQIKKSALIKEEEQRLFSEMNILKNLDHPHIVKLYELYQDQNNYYLITEYLYGGELFDRIKKMTYFSERRAADLMRQILLAVVYCHEQKIVHRDLKPENIIFATDSGDSNLKVIDFGTSRKLNGKQMTKKLGTPYYIAPEVLNQNYNEKCDVWSCGVILYILLCGYPPFTGKNEKEILNKVKSGKYSFDNEDWAMISQDAKTLIHKMLALDFNNRISAKQALNDPWLQKHAPTQPINRKALQNLSLFQAKTVFQQALMSYIVTQMSTQQDTDELAKSFHSLDVNNDDLQFLGLLSRDELFRGYMQFMKDKVKAEEEVDRILKLLDINQSGQIDYSEFLMAAMNQEKITNIKKVEQAFRIFDQDGNGFISKEEIEQVMGDVDSDMWQQFLQECDQNNDGKISQEEFKRILMIKY